MCSFLFRVALHSVLSLAPFGNIISFEKVSSPLQLYPNCQHQKSNLMIMSKELCIKFCCCFLFSSVMNFSSKEKFLRFHSSDFVTSVSCIPDALKSPKTQNNSWYASYRTQRWIDPSNWRCFCRISCSCDFCGSYCGCCLTMHIYFSLYVLEIEGLYFNFSKLPTKEFQTINVKAQAISI